MAGVAALVYFNVSGGPYGSEGLIYVWAAPRTGGGDSLPLGVGFSSDTYHRGAVDSFRQRGYTIWVREAFGPFLPPRGLPELDFWGGR